MKNKIRLCRWHLLFFSILCVSIAEKGKAQAVKSSDYQNNPAWVQMMSDPNVNYYEAVKAYEDYWKGKPKPNNEEEEMEMMAQRNHSTKMTEKDKKKLEKEEHEHEREMERESKRKLTEDDLKQLEWKREMTYQCKRFEDWMRTVKPYVQNDGRILSEEERMKIYEQRQQELKGEK